MPPEFPYRPPDLQFKLDKDFEPLIERYSKGHQGSSGYRYLVLARWGDTGYLARQRQPWSHTPADFRERLISLEDMHSLLAQASNIPVRLGPAIGCFDGSRSLIRLSSGSSGNTIELSSDAIEPPEWSRLLDFLYQLESWLDDFPATLENSVRPKGKSANWDL